MSYAFSQYLVLTIFISTSFLLNLCEAFDGKLLGEDCEETEVGHGCIDAAVNHMRIMNKNIKYFMAQEKRLRRQMKAMRMWF